MSGAGAVVVVPCYNEGGRLRADAFGALAGTGAVELLFVDDGSTDDTPQVLGRMAGAVDGISVHTLARNQGKGEAVRQGMLMALRRGAALVGYYDADLATPPEELLRLVETARSRPELAGVLGSRVARLGGRIRRKALRHYVGRVYATLASTALGITVYDTQCGAKVFRADGDLADALANPFRSAWFFDVELLQRLLQAGSHRTPGPAEAFLEVPLDAWEDVDGSKIRFGDVVDGLFGLWMIRRRRGKLGPAGQEPAARERVRVPVAEPTGGGHRANGVSTRHRRVSGASD